MSKSQHTFSKRQREKDRQKKNKEKREKMEERKNQKAEEGSGLEIDWSAAPENLTLTKEEENDKNKVEKQNNPED